MWKLSLAFCLITVLFINNTNGERQEFVFYVNSDCSGRSEQFRDSARFGQSWVAKEASSFKIKGLWKLDAFQLIGNGGWSRTLTFSIQPKESKCITKKAEGLEDFSLTGVERFGPPDTATSQLIGYNKTGLEGTSFTVTGDTPRIGGGTVSIPCFAQFSNDAWKIYPQVDYKGSHECLCGIYDYVVKKNKGVKMPSDGFQYFNIDSRTVGSVKIDKNNDCKCKGKNSSGKLVSFFPSTILLLCLVTFFGSFY